MGIDDTHGSVFPKQIQTTTEKSACSIGLFGMSIGSQSCLGQSGGKSCSQEVKDH